MVLLTGRNSLRHCAPPWPVLIFSRPERASHPGLLQKPAARKTVVRPAEERPLKPGKRPRVEPRLFEVYCSESRTNYGLLLNFSIRYAYSVYHSLLKLKCLRPRTVTHTLCLSFLHNTRSQPPTLVGPGLGVQIALLGLYDEKQSTPPLRRTILMPNQKTTKNRECV